MKELITFHLNGLPLEQACLYFKNVYERGIGTETGIFAVYRSPGAAAAAAVAVGQVHNLGSCPFAHAHPHWAFNKFQYTTKKNLSKDDVEPVCPGAAR